MVKGPPTSLAEATPDHVESMIAFLALNDIGRACNVSGWTIDEEVRILAGIARGTIPDVKPRDRIMAATRLRQIITMGLRMAGLITDVSRTGLMVAKEGDTQTRILETQRTSRLLQDAVSDTERALASAIGHQLPAPQEPHEPQPEYEIIDAEHEEPQGPESSRSERDAGSPAEPDTPKPD